MTALQFSTAQWSFVSRRPGAIALTQSPRRAEDKIFHSVLPAFRQVPQHLAPGEPGDWANDIVAEGELGAEERC